MYMDTTLTQRTLADRGRAFTALQAELDAHGDGKLHAAEREIISEAASALLFGEDDAADKHQAATVLLTNLVSSGRWIQESIDPIEQLLGQTAA